VSQEIYDVVYGCVIGGARCGASKQTPHRKAHPWLVAVKCPAGGRSSLDLTMNVYTDPSLLDVAGVLDALPCLPLESTTQHGASTPTLTQEPRGSDDHLLTPTCEASPERRP
jgi:hypothetical protein